MNNKQKIAEAKARVSQLTENRINIYDLRLNETLGLTEKKKKLDPVDAKELEGDWEDRLDADIDNDDDEDESDEYLHNRRKTIKKAMKKEEKECDCDMEDDDEHDEDCPMYKMKKESIDEAVNVRAIQKAVDDGKSMDVIMTMFANKRTTNTDEIRKVVRDYMWKKRMKKESVKLDESMIKDWKPGKGNPWKYHKTPKTRKEAQSNLNHIHYEGMLSDKEIEEKGHLVPHYRTFIKSMTHEAKRQLAKMQESYDTVSEATIDYKVNVEGLPPMFIDAKNPGEVKMKLRKLLRRPDSIGDVTRITKADLKKYFRIKGMGKDPEEVE